ncbi:MAG: Serine dehydratase [Caulobacteraceae bacterium]|nr:Serine dehydratase [Caulobacteraceae bacterium]
MLSLDDIEAAARRIGPHVHQTPVLTSESLDRLCGGRLFFKAENLQKVGAFKARGATNAVMLLSEAEVARGVATHSSGNHAAALARAAALRGANAYIVMPTNAPEAKQAAVRRYGGDILYCEPTLAAREAAAAEVVARTGAVLIHPYDDPRVMAGQGTAALELMRQVPDLDLLLCPVGGGGLLSGCAVAAKALRPAIAVVGVEPAGADDARRSFEAGRLEPLGTPDTVADGLRTALGRAPFAEILKWVDDIVTVDDDAILGAMRLIWEVAKTLVEPSGAVAYAAVTAGVVPAEGRRVGIVLSGGNLDLNRLPWSAQVACR